MSKYIIALDQGTTSSRAVLFSDTLTLIDICQKEFTQIFPKDGWVEHNPEEIWESQWTVLNELIKKNSIKPKDILSIGITNQRETIVIWDKETGVPVYNAIVWQDRRTATRCDSLKEEGIETIVRENTGLTLDPYFSSSKIEWLLENIEGCRERANQGTLLAGTIDTWLIWKLTKGTVHATDVSNASRTMLFNITTLAWDKQLLDIFNIPKAILPEVKQSADDFGHLQLHGCSIPITGVAGDQQAATFGQGCFEPGSIKNTYGTGCFMVMNTGSEKCISNNGLLTTIAWKVNGTVCYALEGSVFIGGAAIQWLRDGLSFFKDAKESELLAKDAHPDSNVMVIPAFTGLGAPYWNSYVRGALFGLTRDSGAAEITQATLRSIAYQSKDLLEAMKKDTPHPIDSITVDGGACANNYLMQFQSDILRIEVNRPKVIESTARGAAALAGLYLNLWNLSEIQALSSVETTFTPHMDEKKATELYSQWLAAVQSLLTYNA